jgi:hypothetical protein
MLYVLPGFIGRQPWKRADITALGVMTELASGSVDWWKPGLTGINLEVDALLPYWLGAWAIQIAPAWMPSDFAARVPFVLLLIATLLATWYGTYYLARSPLAQPVAFAFGGEARPTDYARAVADAGVLAFVASLGLAQLAHETTPALAQLCFVALLYYAVAALPYRWLVPGLSACLGLFGLTLSGAPVLAVFLSLGCATIYLFDKTTVSDLHCRHRLRAAALILPTLLSAVLASKLNLWHWRIDLPQAQWSEWQSLGRLFLWFTWPTWPLAIWTLWRWRKQLLSSGLAGRHLWLPLCFVTVAATATLTTPAAERSLLLALPALATLAAFALPTLGRSLGALIDWFTLLFFSGCALIIWVVWISMQTGFPAQPAANVMRLAPGFIHSFSLTLFLIAFCASLAWVWLVKWRVGRHRAAIWKSLVLPAGGAALCWALLMTLWLPLLDFARSYLPMVSQTTRIMQNHPGCVQVYGLNPSQTAALRFHGNLTLQVIDANSNCPWLVVEGEALRTQPDLQTRTNWRWEGTVRHPADRHEQLHLFSRTAP